MKFVEIVELTESLETKFDKLSDAKLALLESIIEEGDTSFDVDAYADHLVEYIDSYSDENATIIKETVDGGTILEIILESATKHLKDTDKFIAEAVDQTGNIDLQILEEDTDDTATVSLLSVVSNTLTEMLGEEAVEAMPAEMVFDIAESTKTLDISDDSAEMDIVTLVAEISEKIKTAVNEGTIDMDTDDYEGETLSEFLDDYADAEDLFEEMSNVDEEILSESDNEDGVRLMTKAKEATIMLEAKMQQCAPGDLKCMQTKAKKAKTYYRKNAMPGGAKPQDMKVDALTGKLGKHVKAAVKAFKKKNGKPPLKDYIQFVLVPGIIKRMRIKNKKMNAKSQMKKAGMK